MTGKIHSVETFGAVDGPGIRYVLFTQGCALRCAYCHNPDTWDASDSAGCETTAEEVVRDVMEYREFAKGGFTISGGEPLLQPEFCAEILTLLRRRGVHTAIDTAGSVPLNDKTRAAIDAADMLLLDIKTADNSLKQRLLGCKPYDVVNYLDYCERQAIAKPVWIRHVVVPGLTLDDERLAQVARLIKPYTCVKRVELLPFHKMGEFKWAAGLDTAYTLSSTNPPTEDEMIRAKAIFADNGVIVDN